MDLLATTTRGLESIAAAETDRLVGASPRVHHPGWIAFEGETEAIVTLNARARTLNRVLVSLVDRSATTLDTIAAATESVPVADYVDPGQSIAVESTRIGSHEFGSPDVSDVVGQAILDSHRGATGDRLPVDLDDPDVVFRAVVRHDRFTLAIDTTGPVSLHRRPYRVRDHPAPVKPTIAAAMLDIADADATTTVADPFCGVGTVPIEAALAANGRSPNATRETFAFQSLPFVPGGALAECRAAHEPSDAEPTVLGADSDRSCVRAARENAAVADASVEWLTADARSHVPAADVVVTDLPFDIRTDHGDLRPLYREFCAAVADSGADRLVALTVRPDLLTLDIDRSYEFRDGRLDVTIADIAL